MAASLPGHVTLRKKNVVVVDVSTFCFGIIPINLQIRITGNMERETLCSLDPVFSDVTIVPCRVNDLPKPGLGLGTLR